MEALPVSLYGCYVVVKKPLGQVEFVSVDEGAEDIESRLVPGVEHLAYLITKVVIFFRLQEEI